MKKECATLNGCPTGQAKLTGAYNLPCRHVIHTVGPIGEQPDLLASCYIESLELARKNGLATIAFPCISTGVYGYPNEAAAKVVVETVKTWMEKNGDAVRSFLCFLPRRGQSHDLHTAGQITRIVFCVFLDVDEEIYTRLLSGQCDGVWGRRLD